MPIDFNKTVVIGARPSDCPPGKFIKEEIMGRTVIAIATPGAEEDKRRMEREDAERN